MKHQGRHVKRAYFNERGLHQSIARMERDGYVVVSVEGVHRGGEGCGCFPGSRLRHVSDRIEVTYVQPDPYEQGSSRSKIVRGAGRGSRL